MVRCRQVVQAVVVWVGRGRRVSAWSRRIRLALLALVGVTVLVTMAGAAAGVARVAGVAEAGPLASPVLLERRCEAALAWRAQLTLADVGIAWQAGEREQRDALPILRRYLFQAQSEITRYCGE